MKAKQIPVEDDETRLKDLEERVSQDEVRIMYKALDYEKVRHEIEKINRSIMWLFRLLISTNVIMLTYFLMKLD